MSLSPSFIFTKAEDFRSRLEAMESLQLNGGITILFALSVVSSLHSAVPFATGGAGVTQINRDQSRSNPYVYRKQQIWENFCQLWLIKVRRDMSRSCADESNARFFYAKLSVL